MTRPPFGCSLCTMSVTRDLANDSHGHNALQNARVVRGGAIPGLPGVAAFHGAAPDPASIPVVLAAPHAGRCYPPEVLAALRVPDHVLLRLEDRLVDRLVESVARETGATFLVADAPRAMIDLNRAVEDIDWDMLADAPRPAGHHSPHKTATRHGVVLAAGHSGYRARSGLGLVPRRLPGVGELWRQRLRFDELGRRIGTIHQPYHATLESLIDGVQRQWGAALLIDLHSMPPLSGNGGPPPQFVIGDRFGTACDGEVIAALFAHLAAAARPVAHNRPYAGGFVLDRHARRSGGIHAVQIEIDRTAYLDAAMAEPGPGFDSMVALLSGIVRNLADHVAGLGRNRLHWRAAAE